MNVFADFDGDVSSVKTDHDLTKCFRDWLTGKHGTEVSGSLKGFMGNLDRGDGRKFRCKTTGSIFEPVFLTTNSYEEKNWVGIIHEDNTCDHDIRAEDSIVVEIIS